MPTPTVPSRRAFLAAAAASAALVATGCAREPEHVIECPADPEAETPSASQTPILSEVPLRTELDLRVDETLASLTTEQKVLQLFCIHPEALTGVGQVTVAGETTRAMLEATPVGGLIYFGHNIVDEQQFRDLVAGTAAMPVPVPLFLAIDEEGGPLVARIANSGCFAVESFPNMSEIGATGDHQNAFRVGDTIGAYLADIGLNVDFAPVADVLTNPACSIGPRAFSNDPAVVASMTSACVAGLQGRGVSAAVKHFPGHGDAAADSHTGAAVSERTLDELRSCEFVPFKAAIDAGVDFVMVGHITTPNAAGDGVPATISRTVITDWLRGELGFKGVVVSDAMNMGAITDFYAPADAAIAFILAGGDVVLDPIDFDAAHRGVLAAVNEGIISSEVLDAAVRRILRVKLSRNRLIGRPAEHAVSAD